MTFKWIRWINWFNLGLNAAIMVDNAVYRHWVEVMFGSLVVSALALILWFVEWRQRYHEQVIEKHNAQLRKLQAEGDVALEMLHKVRNAAVGEMQVLEEPAGRRH